MKKILKQSKRTDWKKYCSSLNKDIPIGSIWIMAKIFKGNKKVFNNNEDYKQWIIEFVNKHSPLWKKE